MANHLSSSKLMKITGIVLNSGFHGNQCWVTLAYDDAWLVNVCIYSEIDAIFSVKVMQSHQCLNTGSKYTCTDVR